MYKAILLCAALSACGPNAVERAEQHLGKPSRCWIRWDVSIRWDPSALHSYVELECRHGRLGCHYGCIVHPEPVLCDLVKCPNDGRYGE